MWERIKRWFLGTPPEPSKGFSENLSLSENLDVSGVPEAAARKPKPGTRIVEVYDVEGELVAAISERVPPVQKGAWKPNGVPATYVIVGDTGLAHQELEFSLPQHSPILTLPEIASHPDAARVRVYWSCEHA